MSPALSSPTLPFPLVPCVCDANANGQSTFEFSANPANLSGVEVLGRGRGRGGASLAGRVQSQAVGFVV